MGALRMSLPLDITFWIVLFLGTALLLFVMVYSLVLLGDLSRDLINPIELCNTLNRVVPLEYAGHAALVCVLLLRGYWVAGLVHAPLLAFHAHRVQTRAYVLDNTQIFQDMHPERRRCEVKLVFYLCTFFLYLYYFIRYLIEA